MRRKDAPTRDECPAVSRFVAERCAVKAGLCVRSLTLYQAFEAWARAAGVSPILGRKRFTDELFALGLAGVAWARFESNPAGSGSKLDGIALK